MSNELYHHGVKGMKWGVRKDRRASNESKLARNTSYRNKLARRAEIKSKLNTKAYNQANSEYNDLAKNGLKSNAWNDEVKRRYESDLTKYGFSSWTPAINSAINSIDKHAMRTYMVDVDMERERYKAAADRWMNSNKNLMNMPISSTTKKRDIRRTYRA